MLNARVMLMYGAIGAPKEGLANAALRAEKARRLTKMNDTIFSACGSWLAQLRWAIGYVYEYETSVAFFGLCVGIWLGTYPNDKLLA